VCVLAPLVVASGAAWFLLTPRGSGDHTYYEDTNNAKQMVEVLRHARVLHAMPDGRIDVYRIFFEEVSLDEDNARILFSNELDSGPTVEEIEAGDYARFAWERARVADVRDAKGRVPVIWYPKPHRGHRLVGFTDGAIKLLTEEEFAELVRSR